MCAENADGSPMLGRDGRPLEAVAYRLSRLKAALTDIRLIAPARNPRNAAVLLNASDSENNALGQAFDVLGGPEVSIRAIEGSQDKVAVWPEIHDDKAVIVCAGKVHRPREIPSTR